MARDLTTICNEALGEIPAEMITAIDDASIGARHCQRLLPGVVDDLLEQHDWDFRIRRVVLAVIANDRAGDWAWCHAQPADMASPRGIATTRWGWMPAYLIANGRIYTDTAPATLEYVASGVDPAAWTAMFARAVALELAARLVMPVLGDRARQGEIARMSELARQRAIADDINRNPPTAPPWRNEAEIARGVDYGVSPWRA